MKYAPTALLGICLCLAMGCVKGGLPLSEFEQTKANAEQGESTAQYNLGLMYDNGEGVLEDDKEAVKWYRKAAEKGHAPAQNNLGFMYDNGEGVLEDYATAYAWINIAAANGDEMAKQNKPIFAKKMTPEDISKAQELSREMVKKNPKLLNE